MGKAGHDGVLMVRGEVNDCSLQCMDKPANFIYGMTQIQAHVGSHLIVAGASGMQAFTGVAHQRGEPFFNIEMHILKFEQPLEITTDYFVFYLREPAVDVTQILSADVARRQHLRMGPRALNIE